MGKVKKEVKRVGRQLERNVRKGLRSFDQEVGVQAQSRELSNLGKTLTGTPKIEQAAPLRPVESIRPLQAVQTPSDQNQESATKAMYRRRRMAGATTGPSGLTTAANVSRKTLLGG